MHFITAIQNYHRLNTTHSAFHCTTDGTDKRQYNYFCRVPRRRMIWIVLISIAVLVAVDSFHFTIVPLKRLRQVSSLSQISPKRYVEIQEYWSLERLALQRSCPGVHSNQKFLRVNQVRHWKRRLKIGRWHATVLAGCKHGAHSHQLYKTMSMPSSKKLGVE